MSEHAIIDPTTTSAWQALDAIAEEFQPDLRAWFEQEPDRAAHWSRTAGDLFVDFSKNLLTDKVMGALFC